MTLIYQIQIKIITDELYLKILNFNEVIIREKITSDLLSSLIKQIDTKIESNTDKNIIMIINSTGGDLIQGINFINWMKKNKEWIITDIKYILANNLADEKLIFIYNNDNL